MHASAMWVPVYNASGNRQDAAFDGSMSLYMNWKLNLDFLHGLVNVPRADNKLELFLWRIHRCNQMHALVRVNTLWKLVIMDAMRWLSGKAHELDKWSLVSADRVLELAEAAFVAIAADGRKLLDANLNPFAEIAALQPVFAAWQAKRAQQEQMAPDGTRHRVYERTLAEARNATSPGAVQATKQTITLAASAALAKRVSSCAARLSSSCLAVSVASISCLMMTCVRSTDPRAHWVGHGARGGEMRWKGQTVASAAASSKRSSSELNGSGDRPEVSQVQAKVTQLVASTLSRRSGSERSSKQQRQAHGARSRRRMPCGWLPDVLRRAARW